MASSPESPRRQTRTRRSTARLVVEQPKRGSRMRQREFTVRSWGGARQGAGRKRRNKSAVEHTPRAVLASRFPVHVTVRLRPGLPSLRKQHELRTVRAAFAAGAERFGFRLCQFSVQSNHLHLIAEAKDRGALSRGMQGLLIRVAKALNRLWSRRGSVFADRYHDRVLRTPRQVRNALVYVLHNARRHAVRLRQGLDTCASGAWFDGWRGKLEVVGRHVVPRIPVARSRTWLLTTGWRRLGLIRFDERPARPG